MDRDLNINRNYVTYADNVIEEAYNQLVCRMTNDDFDLPIGHLHVATPNELRSMTIENDDNQPQYIDISSLYVADLGQWVTESLYNEIIKSTGVLGVWPHVVICEHEENNVDTSPELDEFLSLFKVNTEVV